MATMTQTQDKPLSINAQIEEFLSIITSFASLLETETEAVRKANFKTFSELQENKKFHAKRYEEKIKLLSQRTDEITKIDLKTRETLQKERTRFNIVLEQNKEALFMAQESIKRITNYILEAARKTVTEDRPTNYSMNGMVQTYESASLSLSVDQSL